VQRRLLRLDGSKSHEPSSRQGYPYGARCPRGLDCRRTSCKLVDVEAKDQREPQRSQCFRLTGQPPHERLCRIGER
jgi:hypothetical protein